MFVSVFFMDFYFNLCGIDWFLLKVLRKEGEDVSWEGEWLVVLIWLIRILRRCFVGLRSESWCGFIFWVFEKS